MQPSEDISSSNPPKKKSSTPKFSSFRSSENAMQDVQHVHESVALTTGQKALKRNLRNEVPPVSQQPEKSISDPVQESSTSSENEYRALRRKYLLLEEESFALDRESKEVENEVELLENEKHALLDQLVVLEGLIDPAHVKSH